MKVMFTGKGTSGSYRIRAEQISRAMHAQEVPLASEAELRRVDVAVVVKRLPDALLNNLRAAGIPWVWDVVDSFPQPECTSWSRDYAVAWVRGELERLKPHAVIWPNARMCDDVAWSGPQEVIYHHHRPGIVRNPIRETIRTVGYEGRIDYLDGWEKGIGDACRSIGAAFTANPRHLSDVDVVLALRGPRWNGYPQQAWKSNVKLANAHGSGTPFIGMPECGYEETRTGAEYWVKTPQDLTRALHWLEAQSSREEVSERFIAAAVPVERAAEQYREFLCKLKF